MLPHLLRPFALAACALALLLPVAGCDESSSADDVDALLADARIARQQGDLDEAVDLLEEAHDVDPSSAEVRVELASALLEQADLDLLDLDRVALFLGQATGGGRTAAPAPTTLGATCPYADDPTATLFDPTGVEGYPVLLQGRDAIERVLALLDGTDTPGGSDAVIPAALRVVSLCSGIEDGQLVYDADGALAAMRAAGLSDDQIATALAVNAVARLLDSYFFLTQDLPQQTAWYRLADGGVGVCAADPEALRAQAEEAVLDFGEALVSLDLRADVLNGDGPAQELVALVLDAYETVEADLGEFCGE